MSTGRFIFPRRVSKNVKRGYHAFNPDGGGSKCHRPIQDPVVLGNVPQNRTLCKHCFSTARKKAKARAQRNIEYCYDPRASADRIRAVYHRFLRDQGRPMCKPIKGRMARTHSIPQNRCPCIKCFGKRGRENAKR